MVKMSSTSASQPFVFIVSTDRLHPDDIHARKKIRKQAMNRAGRVRRMRGGYGKHNLLQYPDSLVHSAKQPSIGPGVSICNSWKDTWQRDVLQNAIPCAPPSSGYDQMRARCNFDILDLSTLTSLHVSRATAHSLSANPSILRDIIGNRQWSYLNFIPSRFEHSSLIREAAECVSARVQQWLASPLHPPSRKIIAQYLRALKLLQINLDSSEGYLQADVLCATELLGLYELLNFSTDQHWTCHSSGTAALIRARGPHAYKSEFEKALLLSHIGQIFHWALDENIPCFLDDEDWRKTIRSVSFNDSSFSDRCDLVISLWNCVCRLPYHLQQTLDILSARKELILKDRFRTLQADLRQVRHSILQWCNEYHQHSLSMNRNITMDESLEKEKQEEALGFGLTCLIISNRLIFALDPAAEMSSENEAQSLAARILDIGGSKASRASRGQLFLPLKIHVANTTRATAQSWRSWTNISDASLSPSANLCTLSRRIFVEWCQLTGWKCT
ncbi:hypothetical protein BGZ63DRAFT_397387 [Mariannaea sp. PMI_226]|nr:hypothetical protein BGZ63DRAFT_397387 [Mariannaea sp. PMI_226]